MFATTTWPHGQRELLRRHLRPRGRHHRLGEWGVYGALTGNTVNFSGNGGLHYDEALGNLGRFVTTTSSTTYTPTGFTRYSWREIAF